VIAARVATAQLDPTSLAIKLSEDENVMTVTATKPRVTS